MIYIYNKVKRILQWGLCLLALLPMSAYADYGLGNGVTWEQKYLEERMKSGFDDNFAQDGSSDGSYRINSVWDLCRLAYQVNQGTTNFSGKTFKLYSDIDLDGAIWCPIGVDYRKYFAGHIDGNGHTIKNMRIDVGNYNGNIYSPFYYGLIGTMMGVVKNLKMTGADVEINQNATDNTAFAFCAGLLCGRSHNAIYDCDIQGKINGSVKNSSIADYGGLDQHNIGGIVGELYAPVSIYHCHADVAINVTNANVGGIVGRCDMAGQTHTTNSDAEAWQSYIFDCTANVDISVSGEENLTCKVGGICGYNYANDIFACATTGQIVTHEKYSDKTYELKVGGIAGYNGANIIGCASMVSFPYSAAESVRTTALGGIVGKNTMRIANCVYSGHINNPGTGEFHGIAGEMEEDKGISVNCLFLGTMQTSNNQKPLWKSNGDAEYNYCDQNLYDDYSDQPSVYQSFQSLTSTATSDLFKETGAYYLTYTNYRYNTINVGLNSMWQCSDGFYPRLKIGDSNLTNATEGDLAKIHDYVIEHAADVFGDDKTEIHKAKLFPAYAWLACVPVGFNHNGQYAYYLDLSLSLAMKSQDMETVGNVTYMKTARYSLPADQNVLTISGETDAQTATPIVNAEGDVSLTITTNDKINKQLCLHVNGSRTWDGKVAITFDGGNGTEANPYIIHNARQLILAFKANKKGEYYKLRNDIWFNDNLLTNTGEPKDGCSKWDHESNRDKNNWFAHLDGNGYLIRGLFSTNAFGLIEKIHNDASIVNTGFVDCLTWSPETEEYKSGYGNPFAFLSPKIGGTASVRNCLFDGVVKDRRNTDAGIGVNFCAFIHTMDVSEKQVNEPVVEDCVVSVVAKSIKADEVPVNALFAFKTEMNNHKTSARRILVLNNSHATKKLTDTSFTLEECHWPKGYLPSNQGTAPNDMTDGKFFTGEGFDKWTAKEGRFPMLTTFAGTAYGKLISLPVYTDENNRLDNMNYLMDFTPNVATWTTTNENAIGIDTDIRVLEPKTENSDVYLVRSMEDAKIITPIKTAAEITKGIKFEDEEAKKFCLAHYDDDNNGEVSLSELKNVLLDEFQEDMNENDGNPHDNDGEKITLFPEFHYFAGISDLGTSFQDKEKLRTLDFSNKITELSDDDFKGNTSMESFTIPVSVGTVSGQAFYNSGLKNYYVETDHQKFTATDGVLYDMSQETLLSYPNGRKNTSIEITDNVKTIGSKAVYKMAEVDTVIINAADYDYETVVKLEENAITAADGKQLLFLIEDGTQDSSDDELEARAYSARRAGTVDHRGKGTLLSKYLASEYWIGKNLESFIYLDISEKSKDSEGNYWATLYCGFDTELPDYMTPYIVDKEKTSETSATLVLRRISNKVRMLTPVVIKSTKPVTKHILSPSKSSTVFTSIPMYENLLDGIGRNGMQVYQSDANDGGCLTLGRNSKGEIGFFIYKGKDKLPPYRAYISVNKVAYARELTFTIGDDYSTDIRSVQRKAAEDDAYYNLNGQRTEHPDKGIYIYKGKKVIK